MFLFRGKDQHMLPSGSLKVFIEQVVYQRKGKVQIAKVYQTDWFIFIKARKLGWSQIVLPNKDWPLRPSMAHWKVHALPLLTLYQLLNKIVKSRGFFLENKCECNNINVIWSLKLKPSSFKIIGRRKVMKIIPASQSEPPPQSQANPQVLSSI